MAYRVTDAVSYGVFEVNSAAVPTARCAVKLSSGLLIEAVDDDDRVLGILDAGDTDLVQGAAKVQIGGIARCLVDGSGTSIAAEDPLMVGAGGVLVAWAASAGTGLKYIVGYALEASTASGDIISVDLRIQAINDTAA